MAPGIVMLVEDDVDLRDFLRDLLAEQGYPVVPAENGEEALTALTRGLRPAVILLDLMMPVMDGWQFLEVLRAHGPCSDVPVIVETASKAPVCGAQAVIQKPFDLEELLALVARYCSGAPDRVQLPAPS